LEVLFCVPSRDLILQNTGQTLDILMNQNNWSDYAAPWWAACFNNSQMCAHLGTWSWWHFSAVNFPSSNDCPFPLKRPTLQPSHHMLLWPPFQYVQRQNKSLHTSFLLISMVRMLSHVLHHLGIMEVCNFLTLLYTLSSDILIKMYGHNFWQLCQDLALPLCMNTALVTAFQSQS
jgi:hypothetical protein